MFDPPAEFELEYEWDAAVAKADMIGWDPDGVWCALFSIGPWGAATKLMERDHGGTARLRALPLRTCVAHRDCDYLWSIGDGGCTVWKTTWTPALATDGQVVRIQGSPCARTDIVEVRSFDDDQERNWHGVEVALRDGSCHAIATMRTLESAAWAVDLARTLAAHWSVPYRHVVPAGSRAAAEAKKREADQQAKQLVDGLVDAYNHWDDPDRVAARENREAAQDKRDVERRQVRGVNGDVIARPPAPQNPALEVIAACGKPIIAKSLAADEREHAQREGRVLCVDHAGFARREGPVEDADLVFNRTIPTHIDGSWGAWKTEADVYASFGVPGP